MAREYFAAYHSYLEAMEQLNDAEKGRLFTACLIYSKTGEAPQLSGNERFVFPAIKSQIDRDSQKYDELSKAQAEKARKRWDATACSGISGIAENAKEKEKEKKKTKEKEKTKENIPHSVRDIGAFARCAGDNAELLKAFSEFEKMRKAIKKPLTERAKELIVLDLQNLTQCQDEWVAILNQSIARCWQGVFPLKDGAQQTAARPEPQRRKTFSELIAEEEAKGIYDAYGN